MTVPDRIVNSVVPRPILWTESEPMRLHKDQKEVNAFAPSLEYQSPADGDLIHGGWVGVLPRWPFERPQPEALDALLGDRELEIILAYSAAHPMVPPVIFPIYPEPSFWERTQSAWHVAPNGSLCLLQSDGGWRPEASITELLAKASGWRIEYALMKAGVLNRMSVNGIVSDPTSDHLITQAVQTKPTAQDSNATKDTDVSS